MTQEEVRTMAELIGIIMALIGIGRLLIAQGRKDQKLNEIIREVKPNGGFSLKDRVMKLEIETKRQTETLEDQNKKLDRIEQHIGSSGHRVRT